MKKYKLRKESIIIKHIKNYYGINNKYNKLILLSYSVAGLGVLAVSSHFNNMADPFVASAYSSTLGIAIFELIQKQIDKNKIEKGVAFLSKLCDELSSIGISIDLNDRVSFGSVKLNDGGFHTLIIFNDDAIIESFNDSDIKYIDNGNAVDITDIVAKTIGSLNDRK